jgi:hypothetical protein
MIAQNQALTGSYTPIYLGNPLIQFFNNGDFGSIDPADDITNLFSAKLMDFLPCLKSGFCLRNSLTLLFFIYAWNNKLQEKENLQFFHLDDVMNKCFVEINAEFYTDDIYSKMHMTKAIERGIIVHPLSTQQVIRIKRPEFNQDNTPIKLKDGTITYKKATQNYYMQLLCSLNYYSKNDLALSDDFIIIGVLDHEIMHKQMMDEHNIIYNTLERWKLRKTSK